MHIHMHTRLYSNIVKSVERYNTHVSGVGTEIGDVLGGDKEPSFIEDQYDALCF